MKFQAIKGTRDILPPDSALWNRVEQTAREVFESYGFGEIRLPIFEQNELFARSVGLTTDIVTKEMYSFPDPLDVFDICERAQRLRQEMGQQLFDKFAAQSEEAISTAFRLLFPEDLLSLRPEATAPVCRAYIEQGMHTRPGNVKLYYIGPMFRRERPQKGRYRQFYQIGAEVLGQSDAPAIDAEVIEMLMHFFDRATSRELRAASNKPLEARDSKLAAMKLYINSIGCKECRPKYVAALKTALEKVKDKLGADSQRRIETNPLRVLDSKLESEQAVIEKLPRISDSLCDACRAHFAEVQRQLRIRNLTFDINWRLVRGLDYYTRTTFEITAPGLGAQDAVCGGGRYDGLVELLGGPKDVKGIGFAIGTDRLILSLQELQKAQHVAPLHVFIAWMGAGAQTQAIRMARELRDAGLCVEVPPEEMKFRKALDLASRLGARYALILGEDEVNSGQFTVKRMADGVQEKVAASNIAAWLKRASEQD
jgi:histidyl-tRNA synthetase